MTSCASPGKAWEAIVGPVVDAISYHDESLYWCGEPVFETDAGRESRDAPDHVEPPDLEELTASIVYSMAYTRGAVESFASETERPHNATGASTRRDLEWVALLDRHSEFGLAYEDGWVVTNLLSNDTEDRNTVTVQRHGIHLRFPPVEFEGVAVGDQVSIPRPSTDPDASSGFVYFAHGNEPLDRASLVRVYWNLTAGVAPAFVAAATAALSDAPAHMKVLWSPQSFSRCDAAVMYCSRHDLPTLDLGAVAEATAMGRPDRTPLFAHRLAPGLALAAEPGSGESFGMFHAKTIARGLVAASRNQESTRTARLRAVEAAYTDAGWDPTSLAGPGIAELAASLALDSSTEHESVAARVPSHVPRLQSQSPTIRRSDLLGIVGSVASALAESAHWSGRKCTWLAPPSPPSDRVDDWRIGYRTVGAGLLNGLQGISAFLLAASRLHEFEGDSGQVGRAGRGADKLDAHLRESLVDGDHVPDPIDQLVLRARLPLADQIDDDVDLRLDGGCGVHLVQLCQKGRQRSASESAQVHAAADVIAGRAVAAESVPPDLSVASGVAGELLLLLCLPEGIVAADTVSQLAASLGRQSDRFGELGPTVDRGAAGMAWALLCAIEPAAPNPLDRIVARAQHGTLGQPQVVS